MGKRAANPRAHFPRGFFGEGDGEDGADEIALFQQMQITPYQRKCLAGTRARRDCDSTRRIRDGLLLVAFEGEVGE